MIDSIQHLLLAAQRQLFDTDTDCCDDGRMHLGKLVEAERKRRGWTQSALAARVPGLTQQALDRLEKRDSKKSEFAVQIAAALGMPLEVLLSPPQTGFKVAENDPAPYRAAVTLAEALPVVLDALRDAPQRDELRRLLPLLVDTDAPAYRQRLAELLKAGPG